jgi:protein phosphatase
LSGLVRREEFAQLAAEHADLPLLCSALINLANARGGPDNITVVAARFEGEGLPPEGGAGGVAYRTYQLPETESEPEFSPPEDPAPALRIANSSSTAAHLRSLGLIVVILALIMLLLVVWR